MTAFVAPELKYRLEIDEEPRNPRKDWDGQLGRMVCWHRRENLGDETINPNDYEYETVDALIDALEELERTDPARVWLPLYLYEHSGMTMRTTPFHDPWDSAMVGFIYTSQARIDELGLSDVTDEKLIEYLEGEVTEYDQYLTGDVWGYIIEDEDGEHIDSCWGFFGHEYAEGEAKLALKAVTPWYVARKRQEFYAAALPVPGAGVLTS
jgi:hypothetical protein